MSSVCLYFKVHQHYRLDRSADKPAIDNASDKCYLPANDLLLQLIEQQQGKFRISFSISGTAIDLLQQYRPDVIQSFRELVNTGCVEILAETYYHSLASLHSVKEWQSQVHMHSGLVEEMFGIRPAIYRNTELIHHNDFTTSLSAMGIKAILCEGVGRALQGRSPNHLYKDPIAGLPLLLRNAQLSDDIAFRFDDHSWSEHPLTADKFAEWLHGHPANTDVINLFMDYETFGIHKQSPTGIFDFLQALPAEVLKHPNFTFALPSEIIQQVSPIDTYNADKTISWEDRGDAACVWSENMMQHNMLQKIYELEKMVTATGCTKTLERWRQLQSADHFYYMTSHNEKYRNPYRSGQEAYEQYNKVIAGFEVELIHKNLEQVKRSSLLRTAALSIF